MRAAERGYLDLIEDIISKDNDSIHDQDKHGRTALMYAALNGHLETVRYLVGNGAKVNIMDSSGNTALHYATHHVRQQTGHLNVVQYLVHNGADVDIKNNQNEKAQDIALKQSYEDIFDALQPVKSEDS